MNYNRKLLAKLSQCAWKVLSTYLKQSVPFDDAVPGAAIAVHTFGDFQQYNPHRRLITVLKVFINNTKAMCLVQRWLSQGAHHRSLLRSPRGISQGSILSPLFCNLYLNAFDIALTKANIPFVRFADDFLLFSRAKQGAVKARHFAEKALEELGLELHPKKTHIVRSGSSVIFLGERLPNP